MRMHARSSSSSIIAAYIYLVIIRLYIHKIQIHAEGNCTYVSVKGVGCFIRIYGDTPGHILFLQCSLADGIWEHPYMTALLDIRI